MTAVVRIVAPADGSVHRHNGRWVARWNAHTPVGTCAIETTADRTHAKRFKSADDAERQWRTVSNREPVRADGQPNRPLTAFSIDIEDAEGGFPE
jgi:hypothetical protein